jgi:hypothetical protein
MLYLKITASATIETTNHKDLLAAWRLYGGPGSLVGSFKVKKPLTEAQLRRLPAALRDKMA